MEREINAIWGIYEARSLPRRIVMYALGFVAVPAMVGGAVYLTSWAIEQSIAAGINDNGDIVGFLTTSNGSVKGFLLRGTTFTLFSFPHSNNTTPFGINLSDQIVGSYVDGAGKTHGFLLTNPLTHAHYQSIDDPNGIGTTIINGINDNASLVGFYVDSAGNTDGFLATKV